jgi:hypothetical protein
MKRVAIAGLGTGNGVGAADGVGTAVGVAVVG